MLIVYNQGKADTSMLTVYNQGKDLDWQLHISLAKAMARNLHNHSKQWFM